jgi:hypothetical protein
MRRIKVEKTFGGKSDRFDVLEGGGNMLTVVYTGSLENAMSIKQAYFATGEYTDESEEQYRQECQHNNATPTDDPITYHCRDCGENFVLSGG